MLVWRICSRRHQAFDGEGARRFGGRWNHKGTPIVYTSATLSLAALEFFVNLAPDVEPSDLVAVSADLPEDIQIHSVKVKDLPHDWRRYPAPEGLQDLGTRWVRRGPSAVLVLPSAVIPHEDNYLLNPAHAEFKRLRINKPQAFHFDPRMWK